jgi:tetratricopeptide (TPR) repeat protein
MSQDDSSAPKKAGVDISGRADVRGDVVGGDKYVTEAPAPVVPALHQLPAPPEDFTGREEELKELRAAIASGGATISGLTGQGGVGKTVLALKLADEIKGRFPDAQIYLNLLGVSEKPLTPSDAMAFVIRAFEPDAKLPDQEQALAGKYRSVLDGKGVLLLMDNAKDAAQVGPLIPPKGCFFLVTSRLHFSLPGLRAKDLNTLPPAKAEELLLKIEARIGAEAPAIAKLCGYLPQALRLAATALAERVNMAPSDYRQRLADEQNRPKLLAAGNESVEASISLSYGLLDAETQKRWRMLGVFPETFDGAAAAAVWSAEKNSAEDTLGLLTQYSMLEWNEKTRRSRLHDLMRDFARQKLADKERYEPSLRHAQHYLEVLRAADGLYKKGGDSLMSGLALFDLEWGNIEAGQAWAKGNAADNGTTAAICSDYPYSGANCLSLRQHPREWIGWLEAGLAAARRSKNRSAEGVHLGNLGNAYISLGEYRRAIEYHEQVLRIAREIGDRRVEASALGGLGIAHSSLGEYRRAIEYHEQYLHIAREIGDQRGESNALGSLGNAYQLLAEYRRADECYEQALRIFREIGDRQGEGKVLGGLGSDCLALGEYPRAIEYFEQRLLITREIGDRRGEGNALGSLGVAYKNLGEYRRAIEYYEQHLPIAREIGDRYGECTGLWNMSVALDKLGDRKGAIKLAEASLKIHEEIEDPFASEVRRALEEWRKS